MKRNIGSADRITRIIIAAVIALLYFTSTITGVWGIVLMVAAGIILLTGIINFCPIYYALGINTNRIKS